MNICEGCKCSTVTGLYTMPDSSRLCDYCSDAWVAGHKLSKKEVHAKREYNDTKWAIRQKYGTIAKFADKHGFNRGTVNQVLNQSGYYAVTDIDEMSTVHLDILIAVCDEGYEAYLASDGYVL